MNKEELKAMLQAVIEDYDNGNINPRNLIHVLRLIEVHWDTLTK